QSFCYPSLVLAACLSTSDLPPQSDEWFALRKDKLTTSTFNAAFGFWKRNCHFQLWHEKSAAIERYESITGLEVNSYGFAVHSNEQFDWLGASPNGLLGCFPDGGILEVKYPYNKGKPEIGLPWSTIPSFHATVLVEICDSWSGSSLLGKEEEEIKLYAPESIHKQTGLAIMKSMKLAADANL
ncbi:hypothetical protein RJ641_002676, partial [Dillenia turbinata]